MPGDQIQNRSTAPVLATPIAAMPDERMNPSSPARPSLNSPPGMQKLGRAPQSSGASASRAEPTPAPTLTRASVDSRSPSPALSTPPARNPQVEIDAAIERLRRYEEFIKKIAAKSPDGQIDSPNMAVARASLQAMEAVDRGIDAFAKLPSEGRKCKVNALYRECLQAARFTCATRFLLLRDLKEVPLDAVREGLGADVDMKTLVARRADFEKALVDYRKSLGQTLTACEVTRLAGQTGSADSNDTNRLGLLFVGQERGHIMALTINRLRTYANELSASLNDTLQVLVDVLSENEDVLPAASRVLTSFEVDQQALPAALEDMENIRRQLEGMAQELCLIASHELGSDAPTWKLALECAVATREFTLALAKIMERGRSAPAEPGSRAPTSTGQAADSSAGRTTASRAGDGMSGGGKKRGGRKGKQRPPRAASQVAAEGVSAPADEIRTAVDSAVRAMARAWPLTRQMAGDDPVEVARALGESTNTIDLFRRHHADPMHIAGTVRSLLPKWFGDIKQLRAQMDKFAALPSEKRSDPDLARLEAELTERISVLEAMPDKVTAREIEDIKQYQFPKEKHLERLLDLGEIARVSRPMMLPSSGDDGGPKGRLFEMMITPKPLADGSSAPALYLHLHTDMPVTAQDVSGIPLKNFAAVHVKSAEQRRLGAKWVAMREKLGYDDTVHRGPIGSSLLSRLRVAAEASPRTLKANRPAVLV